MAARSTWLCPQCESDSTKCYRCTECGFDLAGKSGESQ